MKIWTDLAMYCDECKVHYTEEKEVEISNRADMWSGEYIGEFEIISRCRVCGRLMVQIIVDDIIGSVPPARE